MRSEKARISTVLSLLLLPVAGCRGEVDLFVLQDSIQLYNDAGDQAGWAKGGESFTSRRPWFWEDSDQWQVTQGDRTFFAKSKDIVEGPIELKSAVVVKETTLLQHVEGERAEKLAIGSRVDVSDALPPSNQWRVVVREAKSAGVIPDSAVHTVSKDATLLDAAVQSLAAGQLSVAKALAVAASQAGQDVTLAKSLAEHLSERHDLPRWSFDVLDLVGPEGEKACMEQMKHTLSGASHPKTALVAALRVVVRNGSSDRAGVNGVVLYGTKVEVLSKNGEWAKVRFVEGPPKRVSLTPAQPANPKSDDEAHAAGVQPDSESAEGDGEEGVDSTSDATFDKWQFSARVTGAVPIETLRTQLPTASDLEAKAKAAEAAGNSSEAASWLLRSFLNAKADDANAILTKVFYSMAAGDVGRAADTLLSLGRLHAETTGGEPVSFELWAGCNVEPGEGEQFHFSSPKEVVRQKKWPKQSCATADFTPPCPDDGARAERLFEKATKKLEKKYKKGPLLQVFLNPASSEDQKALSVVHLVGYEYSWEGDCGIVEEAYEDYSLMHRVEISDIASGDLVELRIPVPSYLSSAYFVIDEDDSAVASKIVEALPVNDQCPEFRMMDNKPCYYSKHPQRPRFWQVVTDAASCWDCTP